MLLSDSWIQRDVLRIAIEANAIFCVTKCQPYQTLQFGKIRGHGDLVLIENPSAVHRSLISHCEKNKIPVCCLLDQVVGEDAAQLIRAGASGVLDSTSVNRTLLPAMRKLIAGKTYFSPAIAQAISLSLHARSTIELTPREQDVLQHLALGMTYGEICNQLNFKRGSLTVHIGNLYRKLGAHRRYDVITRARAENLLPGL